MAEEEEEERKTGKARRRRRRTTTTTTTRRSTAFWAMATSGEHLTTDVAELQQMVFDLRSKLTSARQSLRAKNRRSDFYNEVER